MGKISDAGYEETEEVLKELEERIAEEYKTAEAEVQEKLNKHIKHYTSLNEEKLQDVEDGVMTEEEYEQWLFGQLAMGERWNELRENLAEDFTNASQIAKSTAFETMPEVYAINHDYGTYQVESESLVDTGYTLYSRESAEFLFNGGTFYPSAGVKLTEAINSGKTKAWNKKLIQSAMTQSILQGESVNAIANRIATTVGERNKNSDIRNARTMTTCVQNAGRNDAYTRANEQGIDTEKEWLAVMDDRTRHEHRLLDGQHVPTDEKFKVGGYELRYPADPSAPAFLVYNCRCTLLPRLARFNGTGNDTPNHDYNEALGDMTYNEWKYDKYTKQAVSEIKSGGHISNETADRISNGEVSKTRVMMDSLGVSRKEADNYVDCIESYTGNEHISVRKYQQGKTTDPSEKAYIAPRAEALEDFIDKSTKWTGGTTYRAIGLTDTELNDMIESVNKGEEMTMLGTSSWSSEKEVADEHPINKANRVVFECKTQKNGTSVRAYQTVETEREVLVSQKSKYKGTSTRTEDGVTYITLEEI